METVVTERTFIYGLVAALLLGCGGGGGGSSSGSVATPPGTTAPPPLATPDLIAAVATGVYSDVLVDCVLAETPGESCALTELPLIGQETDNPTVDDVLARTVISHAWMDDRLREVLQVLPADILTLMKGVTAVVIASDIRPSFYTSVTGAIYIDPAHLWLTNAEKGTISKDPDFRADFGNNLAFVSLWRYLEGTQYAWAYYDLEGFETRSVTDIDRKMAALLFHELAHANDVFPPLEIMHLDNTRSVFEAAQSLADRRISGQLAAFQPLNSQLWMDLAGVLYQGNEATGAQRSMTAAQVGLEFESDGASDDYAYSTSREDLAMLFEELMMRYHYGIDREVAYTNMPSGSDAEYCDYYVIGWGARNRVGDPLVKSRAEFGLQMILNMVDVSAYTNSLPTQWRLVNGRDWCAIQRRSAAVEVPDLRTAGTAGLSGTSRTRMRADDLSIGYR